MKKENCTKGPFALYSDHDDNTPRNEQDPSASGLHLMAGPEGEETYIICEWIDNPEDAELIAEAFNVLHETGMTPRELVAKLEAIARMETASEFDERTDGEGMSGDDAIETLSNLIEDARATIANTH